MFKKKGYKSVYCFVEELRQELKEKGFNDIQIKSMEEVFFGTSSNDYYSEYEVRYYGTKLKDEWWQRLNMLWVVPLFLIASPIRYVMYGDNKVQPNTKLGRTLDFLVGKNK